MNKSQIHILIDFGHPKRPQKAPQDDPKTKKKATRKTNQKRQRKKSEKDPNTRIKPDSAVNGKRRIQTLKGLLTAYNTY